MNGIIRIKKDARYFTASNEPFNDKNLSWEARGVLGYLLSKPDNWVVRNTDLIRQGPAGREKVERILKELKDHGYMLRYMERDQETKQIVWITEIYESPSLNRAIPGKAVDGSPVDGFPGDGSPVDGKAVDIEKTESLITDSQNTERGITEGGSTPTLATSSQPSALEIYQSVTKIKKADKIPEVVLDWLEEQEQYMESLYHPEALRQAIKQADKEGEVFNVELLDSYFSDSIPGVVSVQYTRRGSRQIVLKCIEMSNGDKLTKIGQVPDWIKEVAMKMAEEERASIRESAPF